MVLVRPGLGRAGPAGTTRLVIAALCCGDPRRHGSALACSRADALRLHVAAGRGNRFLFGYSEDMDPELQQVGRQCVCACVRVWVCGCV